MRRIVVSEFVSLDGVMEDPGGAEKFEFGGWTRPYWDSDIGKVKFDELFASDALLLGRVTYEGFAKAWPSLKDEAGFADRMNGLPKYVVSATLGKLEWSNSSLVTGNLVDKVSNLKREPGQDILVAGSATLVQFLMRQDLIDEYRLLVYPVILGKGKRLFRDEGKRALKLVESKMTSSGVVFLRFEPVRSDENQHLG